LAATPLAAIWFGRVSALALPLVALASTALWIALPIPALNVLQSWYQGALTHKRRTRAITEAMAIFLLTSSTILWAGVAWGQTIGLYIGLVAFGAGTVAQTVWLWHRSRAVTHTLQVRDTEDLPVQAVSAPATSK
jgi:O-antigen/teichoic acid export membrane protein